MTVSFALPDDTQKLLAEIKEWSLHEVRPLARTADRLQTKYFEEGRRVLQSCPIDVSPLSVPEFGLIDRAGKVYQASDSDADNHVLGVLAMEAMCYGDGWAWGALKRNANLEKILSVIGTPAQVEKFTADPDASSSFAFSEDHCGSDISAIRTTAVRDGDEWVVNGSKRFSSQGAEASMMLIFLSIDTAQGMNGLRGMMIPQGTPGVEIVRETEDLKLGMRFLRQSAIRFHDVRVPLDHMLGDPDEPGGFVEGLNVLNRTRPFCQAWSVGTLRGATDFVLDHVRREDRYAPRRRAQAEADCAEIHHALDDLMRLLVSAAWLADRDLPHRTEAAMAKSHGPAIVEASYRRLLQIMGSEASSEKHLLEKWYRDAVTFDLIEGTNQILKLTVGRGIFKAAARATGPAVAAALRPVV
ncbi:acyl-CoA dehydrogenase family protein [Sporichthya polymorpha]|uniref:acyl-CoA dehydrogenase family protein n=1 Tax=Sporichthya polymorpha TaxID=35751 RepID=UPI000379DB01|nr:acyl-CoA dehydrogenase [Sporichthya polymorpha]